MSLSHFSSQQCQPIQTTMPERLHMVPYREFTMQIKKAVPPRANPLPYGCFAVSMHAVWGNTHFLSFTDIKTQGRLDLKLLSESELKMQEPFNSCQTTRRPKGTRFFDRKTNVTKFYSWKMTATKSELHTLCAQVVTPKTSVSCLERQFTSSRLNFLWNVLKVKTFLLFKQTKLKVCAPSRRTRLLVS